MAGIPDGTGRPNQSVYKTFLIHAAVIFDRRAGGFGRAGHPYSACDSCIRCENETQMMLVRHILLQTGAAPKHSVNGSRGRWHPEFEATRAAHCLDKHLSSCIWSIAMSFDLLSIAGIASALASGGFVMLLVAAEDRLEQLVDWR
jgi:hypothetical protein